MSEKIQDNLHNWVEIRRLKDGAFTWQIPYNPDGPSWQRTFGFEPNFNYAIEAASKALKENFPLKRTQTWIWNEKGGNNE